MKKIYPLVILMLLASSKIFAQGYSMLNNSNYSPINSVSFNPAKIADSRYKFQMNLFSFNAYFANDYGYIRSVKDVIDNAGRADDLDDILQVNNTGKNKNFDLLAEVKLPLSFVASINEKSSIAFTTRTRTIFSANNIPQKLFSVLNEGLKNIDNTSTGTINSSTFDVNANLYGEAALSYGLVFLNSGSHVLKGGITGKYIFGGGAAQVHDANSSISILEPSSDPNAGRTSNYVVTENLKTNVGYSNGNLLSPGDINFDSFKNTSGTGFAGDIGFEYEWRPDFEKYNYEMDGKTNVDHSAVKYKLKFGAALTDLGSIKYKNGRTLGIDAGNKVTWTQKQIDDFKIDNVEQSLKNVYGNAVTSSQGYKSYLPASLNVNLDYNINNSFYIAANLMQGVLSNRKAIHTTGTLVSVAPRFERRAFEASIPVTYTARYKKVNVGLGLRSSFFFIGSDDLGGLLGFNKINSLNFYTGINFAIGKKRLKDNDNDKISNKFDKCVDVFGPVENWGCPWPDADKDGTPDKDDECPTIAGPASTKGCPDTDGDGTADKDDACPTIPGPIATKGCPDTDGDGILDKDDDCPTLAGPIATKGCPDRDNDGIADKDDACPDEAGPASNNGCPIKKVEVIAAPAISTAPLTKLEQKIISKAVANLQFETGKAIIKKVSFPSLKAVATLLNAHPEFKLTLSGHTDNVGTPAKNLILSQKRADAVKEYLELLSVEPGRITTAGYGQTKPLATNKTAAGKKKNRRVEFKVE